MLNSFSEKLEPIIGLEIHIGLKTRSKMFCGCSADYLRVTTSKEGSSSSKGSYFAAEPNIHSCPVCLGLPGALPVANKRAIEWTILTGLALNCQIPLFSKFDRKNYFYPDLPKGYQISQYDLPLCQNGQLNGVKIRRVHLEEDTAKLIHTTIGRKRYTLIDFNRSGVPLMEIVTEPNITSAIQAKTFLQKLQQIVRYLEVSEADMEKGQMRCEPTVNLKVIKDNKIHFTPLVEIKNINSFRFVQKAIEFEIKRQIKEFQKTGTQKSPGNKTTRGWDEVRQETILQRAKEEAANYRYFPEPDLPPMRWTKKQIEELKKQLPELPEGKVIRFIKNFNLEKSQVEFLTTTKRKASYFEEAVKIGKKYKIEPKEIANVIINKRVDIEKILPAELIEILIKKRIKPILDEKKLMKIIDKVLKKNEKAVNDYKKGKVAALEFLVGQVTREAKGALDPNQTRKILLDALNAS